MIFHDLTNALERAARNGTKAHLSAEEARALVLHPAYAMIQADRIKELASIWQSGAEPTGSNAETSGSNGGPTDPTGPSAGTIDPLVHAAAEERALEAASQTIHQRQRGKH